MSEIIFTLITLRCFESDIVDIIDNIVYYFMYK